MLAVSVALQDSMFCLAHWMLAIKYKAIADKVPLVLARKVPPPMSKCELIWTSILMALNLFMPLLEMAFLVPYNNWIYDKGND